MMVELKDNMKGENVEKILLEKVMIKKDQKIKNLQNRLSLLGMHLKEAESELAEYKNLPGIGMYRSVNKKLRFITSVWRSMFYNLIVITLQNSKWIVKVSYKCDKQKILLTFLVPHLPGLSSSNPHILSSSSAHTDCMCRSDSAPCIKCSYNN